MKYCKKCLYPDTKPQLVFNQEGVCSAWTNHLLKNNIAWERKNKQFLDILENALGYVLKQKNNP